MRKFRHCRRLALGWRLRAPKLRNQPPSAFFLSWSIAKVGAVSEFELEPVRVRVLPHETAAPLALRNEAKTAVIAAAGGVLAGAATVAVVRAVGAVARRNGGRGLLPSRKRQPKVVASRSFLVDVHLLGR
jgi:hypothetical protein